MPQMFWECNRLYFDHQLQTPKFGLMHSYRTLGKFAYRWGEKKKPVKKRYMAILMSDYFDFDEETFRNIMVHEMIHYYLYLIIHVIVRSFAVFFDFLVLRTTVMALNSWRWLRS